MNKYAGRSYRLIPSGSSKISAALARKCQQGEIGESLFRSGISQASFCLFLVRFAQELLSPNAVRPAKTPEQATNSFLLVSGGNASAAQKALAGVAIEWEAVDKAGESILDKDGQPTWEPKQMSVSSYWESLGDSAGAPNLADLD